MAYHGHSVSGKVLKSTLMDHLPIWKVTNTLQKSMIKMCCETPWLQTAVPRLSDVPGSCATQHHYSGGSTRRQETWSSRTLGWMWSYNSHTVDGWNFTYGYPIIYRVLDHPRWLFGISAINSVAGFCRMALEQKRRQAKEITLHHHVWL